MVAFMGYREKGKNNKGSNQPTCFYTFFRGKKRKVTQKKKTRLFELIVRQKKMKRAHASPLFWI
jgi:hypothetical protein